MIRLQLGLDNAAGQNENYFLKNLFFNDFFIGRKRDEKDLLIIRKYVEGTMFSKNPDDFDKLIDYIDTAQDAYFEIEGVFYQGRVKLSEPNYTKKTITLTLRIFDQYSETLDGEWVLKQGYDSIPKIEKEWYPRDLSVNSAFVDGSQYMYDVNSPGDEYWGLEYLEYTNQTVEVSPTWLLAFNDGISEVSIGDIVPKSENFDNYYKVFSAIYSDYVAGDDVYQECDITYVREYRYFEEQEIIPEGWEVTSISKVLGEFKYKKYVRYYGGADQMHFSQKEVYALVEGGLLFLVDYNGVNQQLQKSSYFYNLNELVIELINNSTGYYNPNTPELPLPDDYFTATLEGYNKDIGSPKFNLKYFKEFLRDKFSLYFENETDFIGFKSLSFPTKLIDAKDFRDHDFLPNQQLTFTEQPKILEFQSSSSLVDFRTKELSFYNIERVKETITENVVVDLENTESSKTNLVLMQTDNTLVDRIYEQLQPYDNITGNIAVSRSLNGKFIQWNTDKLIYENYVRGEYRSNPIDLEVNTGMYISYEVTIIGGGNVRVRIGSYDVTHTATTTVNTVTTGTSGDPARINIDTLSVDSYGYISNLTVRSYTRTPQPGTGLITGLRKLNGNLALPNTINSRKPLAPYSTGYLEDYGNIACNTRYSKNLEFDVCLNEDIFGYDINKYIDVDNERFIIFEEKRKVLSENEISEFTNIKCKSNTVI